MRIIRKYVCPVCNEVIEGAGDHMLRKLASAYAGQALRTKINNHFFYNKDCASMVEHMKEEFNAYDTDLKVFLKDV